MVYTKDYYDILGLEPQSLIKKDVVDQDEVKKAYRVALLSAHPDTAAAQAQAQAQKSQRDDGGNPTAVYTVDDVKEAYAVLSDAKEKAKYDQWFAVHGTGNGNGTGQGDGKGEGMSADFILGLDLLDLSDFEAGEVWVRLESGPSTPGSTGSNPQVEKQDGEGEVHTEETVDVQESERAGDRGGMVGGPQVEWTRPCRCGAEKGFRIREVELEEAEARGDTEVLVGCEGCSLWVRVGFDVEEG